LWLGTDPLLDDSDRYLWDGFSIRPLYPSFGDGIPDGWEVHFGLDPLNRSNALNDPDRDGWDANRDGGITADLARTSTAMRLGEALSTLEEYLVHYDNGNTILPGLKTTLVGDEEGYSVFPLVYDAPDEALSVLHHDVRSLDEHDGTVYVMTRYGVTTLNEGSGAQGHQWLPQGVELHDGYLVRADTVPYALVLGTSVGFAVAPLLADGTVGTLESWSWSLSEPVYRISPLLGVDGDHQTIGLGEAGAGSIIEISDEGGITLTHELGLGIVAALSEANATVTALEHGMVGGTIFTLFIGTDRGLFIVETTSGRDEAAGEWRFFYTAESTPVATDVDELRSLPLGTVGNPAEVRDLVLDGPSPSNAQVLWFGTPSGLHKLALLSDSIEYGGLLLHPGVDGKLSQETNSIKAIHPTGDELLIGSDWGLWALAGDYTAVYGI
jgi:hypothetical protein